jgi:predicted hotdog family 3-hydroxylacyl-ACP dehydratase
VCTTTVGASGLFVDEDGHVPGWIALEYMAQCIGVHAGLEARASGEPPRVGFLVGSRRVDFHVPSFPCGRILRVVAEHVWGDTALGSFTCRVEEPATGTVLAEGVLKVFAPPDLAALPTGIAP